MTLQVRAARPEDRAALAAIYRRASLSNAGDRPHLLQHPDALELGWTDHTQERSRVATSDDRIVGFASVEVSGDTAELEDLFVDPDFMRRRIATALIDDILTVARSRGAHRLEVTANAHALDFYRTIGFVDQGMTTTRFGPARRMRLDLGA